MNDVRRGFVLLAAALALGTCTVPGTTITVPNGDFALPTLGPATVYAYSADNWTREGDCGRAPLSQGNIAAFANVTSSGTANGLSQALADVFEEGEYELLVKAGGGSSGLTSRITLGYMEGSTVVEVAHDDAIPGVLAFGSTTTGWVNQSLTVTIAAGDVAYGKPIWIGIKGLTASAATFYFDQMNFWDDVSLTLR